VTAVDIAMADAAALVLRLVELVEARGGSVAEVRADMERIWLECAFIADDSGGTQDMKLRAPDTAEPQLLAELGDAQDRLTQAEVAAEHAISAARSKVNLAQSRLDQHRLGLLTEHAQAWRAHAEDLRRQAAESGDETVVVTVRRFGGMGDSLVDEPRLEFKRNQLNIEADQADAKAGWLANQLLREPDSELLARVASELVLPPTLAEMTAA
jgi:hypothetical protein